MGYQRRAARGHQQQGQTRVPRRGPRRRHSRLKHVDQPPIHLSGCGIRPEQPEDLTASVLPLSRRPRAISTASGANPPGSRSTFSRCGHAKKASAPNALPPGSRPRLPTVLGRESPPPKPNLYGRNAKPGAHGVTPKLWAPDKGDAASSGRLGRKAATRVGRSSGHRLATAGFSAIDACQPPSKNSIPVFTSATTGARSRDWTGSA
jgi:hypothetical protein